MFQGDLPGNTKLTAWIHESHFIVEIIGTGHSIVGIGGQFAWLGAALRSSPYEDGIACCTPFISNTSAGSTPHVSGTLPLREIACEIDFAMREGNGHLGSFDGQCWHNLFRNPVIVEGYPILPRPEHSLGLEIPLDIVTALTQTQYASNFDSKLIIRGFSVVLLTTRQVGGILIWHLLFNEDGGYFSIADPRIRSILGACQVKINNFDLRKYRHVIGWCSNVRSYAGKDCVQILKHSLLIYSVV